MFIYSCIVQILLPVFLGFLLEAIYNSDALLQVYQQQDHLQCLYSCAAAPTHAPYLGCVCVVILQYCLLQSLHALKGILD